MGQPEAQASIETFAKRVASLDATANRALVNAFAPVYAELQRDIRLLLRQANREGLTPVQTTRLIRYRRLETNLLRNISRFVDAAGTSITQAQLEATGLAQLASRTTASAALPEGVSLEMLARVGVRWQDVPTEAFTNFVGIAGDGQPVGNLLANLGGETAARVKNQIGSGILLGKNPRVVADLIRTNAGLPLSKALTIARTETLRAYRESSRLQYAANSDIVKGYARLATKDPRTCIACIALDGKLYELNEPLDSHPNCRCALVPETITYRDLGLDVDMPEREPNAESWLGGLSTDKQRNILGNARYEQWSKGKPLTDFVQIKESPIWGKSATVAPIGG